MSKQLVHIINHTHWDREWFLSAVYTTHWIPALINRLQELSAENLEFRYFFDGHPIYCWLPKENQQDWTRRHC